MFSVSFIVLVDALLSLLSSVFSVVALLSYVVIAAAAAAALSLSLTHTHTHTRARARARAHTHCHTRTSYKMLLYLLISMLSVI